MSNQLTILDAHPKAIPVPILQKTDSIDGWIYICPACKTYICSGMDCKCGQALNWKECNEYKGRYKY